jgi:phage-related protein
MNYSITYYNEAIQADILKLPPTLLARYLSLTERMLVVGSNLGEPHTKAFGGGLFELRLKSSEGIGRVFYCTLVGQRIVMLHSFVKKTQKTPSQELSIALQRLKEIKNA